MDGKPRRSGAKLFPVRQPRIPIGRFDRLVQLTIAAPIPPCASTVTPPQIAQRRRSATKAYRHYGASHITNNPARSGGQSVVANGVISDSGGRGDCAVQLAF